MYNFVYKRYCKFATNWQKKYQLNDTIVDMILNPTLMPLDTYKWNYLRLDYLLLCCFILHRQYNQLYYANLENKKNLLNTLMKHLVFKSDKQVTVKNVTKILYSRGTLYDGPFAVDDFGWFLQSKQRTCYLRVKAVEFYLFENIACIQFVIPKNVAIG